MNFDNFFDGIENVKAITLEPLFYYEIIVSIFQHCAMDRVGVKNMHTYAARTNLDSLDYKHIINKVSERNKHVGSVLHLSKAFQTADLELIENHKVTYPYTWFKYDTVFCSIKTKTKYQINLTIGKHQHPDCLIDLGKVGVVGESRVFYSYTNHLSNELTNKYTHKIKTGIWNDLI